MLLCKSLMIERFDTYRISTRRGERGFMKNKQCDGKRILTTNRKPVVGECERTDTGLMWLLGATKRSIRA